MTANDAQNDPPDPDETERLVQEASVGGTVATDELLARLLPELRAFVRLRAGPRILEKESDDDLVQSVCREVLQDLSGFEYRGMPGFKKWLYTTALRKICDKAKFYGRQMRDAAREEPFPTNPQYYTGYQNLLTASRARDPRPKKSRSWNERSTPCLMTTSKSSPSRRSSGCHTPRSARRWASPRRRPGCCCIGRWRGWVRR